VLVVALTLPGLRPGAFAADKDTGAISGFVMVEAGSGNPKPVAGAEVRITFGAKSDSRKTGQDGKYSFPELLPGKYVVKVIAPDDTKTKGDGTTTVTLVGGESERADFVLISTAKPTATATPTPKAAPTRTPSPKPVVGENAAPGASALMPALVVPYASPSPVTAQAKPSQPSSGPASLASSIGISASPGTVANGTPGPGLIFAIGSPVPQVGAPVTGTPSPTEDVLASGPPRRLITSFEALSATGSGGAATQLKSWATETSLVLGVPFRTQIDGSTFSLVNCGPASLAMVLIAFGLDVDPPSVRDYLNYLVGNYDSEAGTSLYVLSRIAREAGLSTFGTSSGLQGWTIDAVREQVRAGHPVITLTKYRFLPGHFGSVTDFDHYIVITGLAGDDFVYNDAAYSTEYGYNLLISPAQLQRAWAASSVPRHAVAVGFGDSLRPLPIVPRRLTAESLVTGETEAEEIQAVVEAPVRVNRGPAAERLREQTLDLLGARTVLVEGETLGPVELAVPRTRIDPSENMVVEHPSGAALTTSYERPIDSAFYGPVDPAPNVEAVADAGAQASAGRLVPPTGEQEAGDGAGLAWRVPPFGLALIGLGLLLMLGGGVAGWRRGQLRTVPIPSVSAVVRWLPKRR
jgi:hypothetical protein